MLGRKPRRGGGEAALALSLQGRVTLQRTTGGLGTCNQPEREREGPGHGARGSMSTPRGHTVPACPASPSTATGPAPGTSPRRPRVRRSRESAPRTTAGHGATEPRRRLHGAGPFQGAANGPWAPGPSAWCPLTPGSTRGGAPLHTVPSAISGSWAGCVLRGQLSASSVTASPRGRGHRPLHPACRVRAAASPCGGHRHGLSCPARRGGRRPERPPTEGAEHTARPRTELGLRLRDAAPGGAGALEAG